MSEFPAPMPPPRPDAMRPADGPSGPRASFWRRLGGSLIDNLLLGVFFAIVYFGVSKPLGWVVYLVLGLAYFGYLEGSTSGQTIGKRAMGIRVIDFNSGGPIGFGRAVIRFLSHILSGAICYLGYLWMLWDKEKQCWHDKLASDVVVPVSSYPVSSWPN